MASINLTLYLRCPQLVFALINLGLVSYVIHYFQEGSRRASPPSASFLLFATIFSLLSIPYLEIVPKRLPRASHPIASLVIEALNTIFHFSAFVAVADFLGSLDFCNGSVCASARAMTVFGAFEFVAWAATTGLLLLTGDVFKGGLRSSVEPPPSPMIQV